jgi:1-aminocyclopropane-1-carboxylate deaminase/D-cysteine desulfhydrase-like pyridoxal-dependent ACC family enzyme
MAAARALPRTRLAVLPTPLVPAPRLAEALGLRSLLVKRDDLTGFAFGGNKARLLEFLIAGAVADGAGTLLTGGAPGSNFCAATGLGAVGYALAAAELHEQLGGRRDVTVVVPTGSGGTLAGLVAGHLLLGRPWALTGCSASRPPRAAARQVLTLASQCLRLLGTDEEPGPAEITVVDARGPGHGVPSLAGRAAAEEAMRTEGLMLDPVYTAKALALAPPGRDVVFWHTGGVLDAVAEAADTTAAGAAAQERP